jgi:phage replication initiation protein
MGEETQQPPTTNRGVEHTTASGLNAVVDWVQVTFKNILLTYDIVDLLGLEKSYFQDSESGLYGWKKSVETIEKEIRIFYDGGEKVSGTHLMITGQGCRFFEKHSKTNWSDFFAVILNTDINVKRIDLAIDDFEGYYTPSLWYRKIKQSSVTSRFKRGRWIESFNLGEYEKGGTTIYIGSPSSSIQIRCYDKLKERQEKGFLVDEKISCWVRTELQLREERAEGLALMIAYERGSIGSLASGILNNYICFRVRDKKEKNKSRWKVCDWWEKYLNNVEKISLTLNHAEPVLEKTIDWANTQWAKSMYSMYLVFNQDVDMFYKMLQKGQANMLKKDYKRVEEFIEKYGEMTFDEYLEKKRKNEPN